MTKPKIGLALFPVPADVDDDHATEWRVRHAAENEIDVVAGDPRPVFGWIAENYDLGYLRHTRQLADSLGVAIEPYVGGVFGLCGPDPARAREQALASMRSAKVLGGPYLRTAYGQLEIRTSRFSPDVSVDDHLKRVESNLREASALADAEGVVLAIENHVDFTGRQLATVIEDVGSPAVQAALDTGNSFSVFSDPIEDLTALAPLAVMCHLKDMRVIPHGDPGQIPFLPVGCPLGDGHVDIPRAVAELLTRGPRGVDLPLVVETGWVRPADGISREEVLMRSVAYLKNLVVTDAQIRRLLN